MSTGPVRHSIQTYRYSDRSHCNAWLRASDLFCATGTSSARQVPINRSFPDRRLLGLRFRFLKPRLLRRRVRGNDFPTRALVEVLTRHGLTTRESLADMIERLSLGINRAEGSEGGESQQNNPFAHLG